MPILRWRISAISADKYRRLTWYERLHLKIIIPNLTWNVRPYAFVENVVTHGDYRKCGYARACLDYAKSVAQGADCYKIFLMTGAKDAKRLGMNIL